MPKKQIRFICYRLSFFLDRKQPVWDDTWTASHFNFLLHNFIQPFSYSHFFLFFIWSRDLHHLVCPFALFVLTFGLFSALLGSLSYLFWIFVLILPLCTHAPAGLLNQSVTQCFKLNHSSSHSIISRSCSFHQHCRLFAHQHFIDCLIARVCPWPTFIKLLYFSKMFLMVTLFSFFSSCHSSHCLPFIRESSFALYHTTFLRLAPAIITITSRYCFRL